MTVAPDRPSPYVRGASIAWGSDGEPEGRYLRPPRITNWGVVSGSSAIVYPPRAVMRAMSPAVMRVGAESSSQIQAWPPSVAATVSGGASAYVIAHGGRWISCLIRGF